MIFHPLPWIFFIPSSALTLSPSLESILSMGLANGSYLHKENILPIISLSLIFLNVIKAITGQRNIHAQKEKKLLTYVYKKDKEKASFFEVAKKFLTSEMCKNRFLAYNLNKHHNISIYLFSALLLILTRRFSVRLENDLSIGLILMSTHRLSLRSNALMIMDHLYHILHVPPKIFDPNCSQSHEGGTFNV